VTHASVAPVSQKQRSKQDVQLVQPGATHTALVLPPAAGAPPVLELGSWPELALHAAARAEIESS
jgi:hypothetical protein